MSQAIRLDPARPNITCGICWEDISPKEEQWTHKGGERHDPFHKHCLKNWVKQNPTCPMDNTSIDFHSLQSRMERVFEKAKPVLVNNSTLAAIIMPMSLEILLVGITTAFETLDTTKALQTIALTGILGAGLEIGFGTLRRGVAAAHAAMDRLANSVDDEVYAGLIAGYIASWGLFLSKWEPLTIYDSITSGVISGITAGIATWFKRRQPRN